MLCEVDVVLHRCSHVHLIQSPWLAENIFREAQCLRTNAFKTNLCYKCSAVLNQNLSLYSQDSQIFYTQNSKMVSWSCVETCLGSRGKETCMSLESICRYLLLSRCYPRSNLSSKLSQKCISQVIRIPVIKDVWCKDQFPKQENAQIWTMPILLWGRV